jgi:thioredoxin 1
MKKIIYSVCFLFFFLNAFTQDVGDSLDLASKKPTAMTIEEFKDKTNNTNKLVLVNLTADWCPICKKEAPIIEEIKTENPSTVDVLVLDTKKNPLISDYFEVDGLPVLILYKNGEIVWDHMGLLSKEEIMLEINACTYGLK